MTKALKLKRVGKGPILEPRPDVPWEKSAVLNAAAIHDGKLFHLFYRAVAHNPGASNRSCIGHAWSRDGVHFERADEPILRNNTRPDNRIGVEDPRIVKLGNRYYLTYVCWGGKETNVAVAVSPDLKRWRDKGIIFRHSQFGDNKNATLFPEKIDGQYALIHRPMGFHWGRDTEPLDMWLSLSPDLKNWTSHRRLLRARRGEIPWEYNKIGLGAPPFKTDKGWLMVYHGVDRKSVYRIGLVLLDYKDPSLVLKRTEEPILEPEADWEISGDVNNVVFTCGAVLLGTQLWVYYGGADTRLGLAKGDVKSFLR